MTPKDKAKELVDGYLLFPIDFPYNDTQDGQCIGNGYMLYNSAKQCALIAVDEIINYLTTSLDVQTSLSAVNYWHAVKQEIEKI